MVGKKKVIVAILLVLILIILLIGYVSYNSFLENQQITKKDDSSQVQDTIYTSKAKELVNNQINRFVEYLRLTNRLTDFEKEDFNSDKAKMVWILVTSPTEVKSIGNFCGTDIEKYLLELHIIDKSLFTCEDTPVYKASDILSMSEKRFNPQNQVILKNLNATSVGNYFYDNVNRIVVSKAADEFFENVKDTTNYVKHTVKDNILTITFSFSERNWIGKNVEKNYDAKYQIDGDNYYIMSIAKSK